MGVPHLPHRDPRKMPRVWGVLCFPVRTKPIINTLFPKLMLVLTPLFTFLPLSSRFSLLSQTSCHLRLYKRRGMQPVSELGFYHASSFWSVLTLFLLMKGLLPMCPDSSSSHTGWAWRKSPKNTPYKRNSGSRAGKSLSMRDCLAVP